MTDHSTKQQPERDPASSAKKRKEARNRNDIVGRTSLPLPSLTGLEPMPLFLPSEPQQATSTNEATNTSPPAAPTPKGPEPLASAKETQQQPAVPLLPNTEARMRAVPARPVPNQQSQTTASFSSQDITGQNLPHPLRRVRLRPFLKAGMTLAFLFLLIGSAFAYFPLPFNTPHANRSVIIHQRDSPVPQKTNDAQPQGSSIAVGDDPIIELQGYKGNVSIGPGKTGFVLIKTISDQNSNANDANLLHYTQSHDKQGHDLIRIINQTIDQNIHYEILSPHTAQVHITLNSGSIAIAGISGTTITTTNGNISLQDVTGPTSVSTQNGDVTLHNVQGEMVVQASSGSILGTTVNGTLKATTQNGDVIIQQAMLHAHSLLQARQGSVSFTGTIDPKGKYTMKTQSGDITLTLPITTALQLHATTRTGTITNAFSKSKPGNAPQAQVFASTGSGSITIKQTTPVKNS